MTRTPLTRLIPLVHLGALLLAATPLDTQAQQAPTPRSIGVLVTASPERLPPFWRHFYEELRRRDWTEGQNLVVERRSAHGDPTRLPALAAGLVDRKVDVIVVGACGPMLDAARRATRSVPIVVMTCAFDLGAAGIVTSLGRPGGNITGLTNLSPDLASKRLQLLRELRPRMSRVAVLWDRSGADFTAELKHMQQAAMTLGITLVTIDVRDPRELNGAFAKMTREKVDAFIAFSDVLTYLYRAQVTELARQHRLPAIYAYREVAESGGLLAYGPNLDTMARQAALYVDKILRGASPADLPIEQPRQFELIINMKTSKALGMTIPQSLLLRADQVIE